MDSLDSRKIPVTALRLKVDLGAFDPTAVRQTREETSEEPLLGQQRAIEALRFGVAMQNPGYNIYVMGQTGTGRLSLVTNYLQTVASHQPAPPSYAYVDNFEKTREPVALRLPSGRAQALVQDIENLIEQLLATFPAAFESPSYQQKKHAAERRFNQRYNAVLDQIENQALARDIALYRDGDNLSFVPLRKGKALDEAQFAKLPPAEREAFHQKVAALEDSLSAALVELPQWRREMTEELRKLDNETIHRAIKPLFARLHERYRDVDDVVTYLDEIKKDLPQCISDVLAAGTTLEPQELRAKRNLLVERYVPNVLVDHKPDAGAPVVYEAHPTYQNLFGRIEYVSEQGTLLTNYRRICAGSLHRANGGYLILDADKVLTYPFVWEALKRAWQSGRIQIEAPQPENMVNPITLKPEVIPFDVKIILVGARDIYYLLQELDEAFNEMFRVLADFDDEVPLTPAHLQRFATLIVRHAADYGAKPLTRSAIEALVEYSCRQAEHQQKLSARIKHVLDVIGEAEHYRAAAGEPVLDRCHVERALAARETRNGRIAQLILEDILDGTILIDTEGQAIGKINGLTVMEVGDSCFGGPSRITATVYPGSRGIVDIEREVELGQSIHSKGVMILTGYLGHCYAQQFPLAISASIALEQSYGFIDGDSASLAESCALISALTRVPLRQDLAVTGSINQYGEVQAVGGVNEKIEGFFRVCAARGLTGRQGVIIPKANVRHLMLKPDVVDAVAQERFAIYAVTSVNEALNLLTGLEAGELDADGHYPEGSVNHRAIQRLKEIYETALERDEHHQEGGEPEGTAL